MRFVVPTNKRPSRLGFPLRDATSLASHMLQGCEHAEGKTTTVLPPAGGLSVLFCSRWSKFRASHMSLLIGANRA